MRNVGEKSKRTVIYSDSTEQKTSVKKKRKIDDNVIPVTSRHVTQDDKRKERKISSRRTSTSITNKDSQKTSKVFSKNSSAVFERININKKKKHKSSTVNNLLFAELLSKPNHTPLTREKNQSGYIRSSDTAFKNYSSTPLYPKTRSQFTIASKDITTKSSGIEQMKHGFALPLSHRFEIEKQGADTNSDNAGKQYLKEKMLPTIKEDLATLLGVGKISDDKYDKIIKYLNGYDVKKASELKAYLRKQLGDVNFFDLTDSQTALTEAEQFVDYDNLMFDVESAGSEGLLSHSESISYQRNICSKVESYFSNGGEYELKHMMAHYENKYSCLSISIMCPKDLLIFSAKQAKEHNNDKMEQANYVKKINNNSIEHWVNICMYLLLAISEKKGYGFMMKTSFAHREITLADCYQRIRLSPGIHNLDQQGIVIDSVCDSIVSLDKYLMPLFTYLNGDAERIKNLGIYCSTVIQKTEKIQKNMWALIDIFNTQVINDETDFIYQAVKTFHDNYSGSDVQINLNSPEGMPPNSRYIQQVNTDREQLSARVGRSITREPRDFFARREGSCSPVRRRFNESDSNIFARKIILPSAMRATACAMSVIFYTYNNFLASVECSEMYYEVSDMTAGVIHSQHKKTEGKKPYGKMRKYKLGIKDINYLPNTSGFKPIEKEEADARCVYLVLDVTGSTVEEMAAVVQSELINNVENEFIILVASGTKHSYNGYDIGQYGEMRIFSKNEALANKLYHFVSRRHNTPLLEFDHCVRRYFKKVCQLPTNKEILKNLSVDT